MNKTLALIIILAVSIAGMAFSGFLSYGELIRQSCPVGGCTSMFGVPVCVFGFVMYIIVFIVSFLGLREKQK